MKFCMHIRYSDASKKIGRNIALFLRNEILNYIKNLGCEQLYVRVTQNNAFRKMHIWINEFSYYTEL